MVKPAQGCWLNRDAETESPVPHRSLSGMGLRPTSNHESAAFSRPVFSIGCRALSMVPPVFSKRTYVPVLHLRRRISILERGSISLISPGAIERSSRVFTG